MRNKSATPDISLNRQIMRITLPAIASNLTVPLLGLCDTGVTGHLGHPRFIAAISVGAMMLNVLLWSFGFLRMGTTGLTAQAFGARDRRQQSLVFTRALLLALGIGIMLVALQHPLGRLLMTLIGASEEVSGLAMSYFGICIWGVPGLLGSMAVSGWFLGMQDSVRPMTVAIATNVVNIAASILLVFPLGLGFPGTALGTLAANWVSFALALWLARRFNGGRLPFSPLREALRLGGMERFFKVNTDIFLRSFFIMAVSMGVTSFGARMGELTLAANAIVMQLFFLFSYFMDGFAFSTEALSGKCAGASDYAGLRRLVRRLLLITSALTALFTLAYSLGYGVFTRLLAPEADVERMVESMSLWITLLPASSFLAFIFDGLYIGLTATRRMLVVTAVSAAVFYVICLWAPLPAVIGAPDRLWLAFLSYLFTRGMLLSLFFPRNHL